MTVGRDISGIVQTGDYSIAISNSYTEVHQAPPPMHPVPRSTISVLPRRAAQLFGRDDQLRDLVRAIKGGPGPVQVSGPGGVGKSTLLRAVARQLADSGESVVFLEGALREPGDVLQSVFEACYEPPDLKYRPAPEKLRQLMTGVRFVLIVDGAAWTDQQWEDFLDGVPDAVTAIGTARPATLGTGQIIELQGLDRDAAVALLTQRLWTELNASDIAAAEAISEAAGGLPRHLVTAAAGTKRVKGALVWPCPAQLPELRARILAELDPTQRRVMALTSLAGPAGIASGLLEVLTAQSPAGEVSAAARRLTMLGLVEELELGYQAAPEVAEALPENLLLGDVELLRLAEALADWAGDPVVSPVSVADHAPLITAVVEAAVSEGHPGAAARLARAAAPAAALSLRTGEWGRILEHGGKAATLAEDEEAQAYFQHENGVRLLVTGSAVLATTLLATAAAMWLRLGRTAHAAAAQHAQSMHTPHGPVQPGLPHGPVQPGLPHGPVQPGLPHGPVQPGVPHSSTQPGLLHSPARPGLPHAGHTLTNSTATGHQAGHAANAGIKAASNLTRYGAKALGIKGTVAVAISVVAIGVGAVIAVTIASSYQSDPIPAQSPSIGSNTQGPSAAPTTATAAPDRILSFDPNALLPTADALTYLKMPAADVSETPKVSTNNDGFPMTSDLWTLSPTANMSDVPNSYQNGLSINIVQCKADSYTSADEIAMQEYSDSVGPNAVLPGDPSFTSIQIANVDQAAIQVIPPKPGTVDATDDITSGFLEIVDANVTVDVRYTEMDVSTDQFTHDIESMGTLIASRLPRGY